MEPRRIPVFETEAEEAQWWYDHREEFAQDFAEAAKAGRLGPGSRVRFAQRQAEAEHERSVTPSEVRRAS